MKSDTNITTANESLIKSPHIDLNFNKEPPVKAAFGRNNIMHEINAIQRRNIEIFIDYYNQIEIKESEYKESLEVVKRISEKITEDHIIDIKSTKKPFFVYKTVFEIYATIIGEPFIGWKEFKDGVNLPEMTLKLTSVNYRKFSRDILNKLLSRVVALKKFEEYLCSENTASLFFIWIKAVLKICIYTQQNKKEKAVNSDPDHNYKVKGLSPKSGKNSPADSQVIGTIVNSSRMLYKVELKEDNNNNNVYITAVSKDNNSNIATIQSKVSKKLNKEQELPKLVKQSINPVHEQIIRMDYNCLIDKRKRDMKVLESLPLYKYKTFNQLREFYNGKNYVNFKELTDKNLEIIKTKALTNPDNLEKVLSMVSEGRFGVDHQVTSSLFNHFKQK
jgi:hypothetical protein